MSGSANESVTEIFGDDIYHGVMMIEIAVRRSAIYHMNQTDGDSDRHRCYPNIYGRRHLPSDPVL